MLLLQLTSLYVPEASVCIQRYLTSYIHIDLESINPAPTFIQIIITTYRNQKQTNQLLAYPVSDGIAEAAISGTTRKNFSLCQTAQLRRQPPPPRPSEFECDRH